jgi:hypothetical protein
MADAARITKKYCSASGFAIGSLPELQVRQAARE